VSELRRDELSGRWVLFAPGRAARPHTYARPAAAPAARPDCPFCPGNEHATPPEVARVGDGAPDTPGWRMRVVPNLYPIVGGPGGGDDSGARGVHITGAHEVVIFTTAHDRSFAFLSDDEAAEAFVVLRDRVRHHLAEGCAYVQAVVNHKPAAGASIEHPHAQVLAIDFVPPAVAAELERVTAAGDDLVAKAAATAPDHGLAVVEGPAPAWCPEAASAPYAMRIAHRSTRARFDEAPDTEVAVVARSTRDAVRRLTEVTGDAAYNLVVHTAPPGPAGFFHWYVDVQPRLTVPAGFELGTGVDVNIVVPEDAAEQLRAAAVAT
jgi:UDPglucose--hexose-1-phosphate uridylyltransferase